MSDIRHDIEILVSIARADVAVRDHRTTLRQIPDSVARIEKKLAALDESARKEHAKLEALKKEHRALEATLQDHEEKIKGSKTKLTEVKTNQEYTAALKEIETMGREIDVEEERMLELMDEIETFEPIHDDDLRKIAAERESLEAEKRSLVERHEKLTAEVERLDATRPGLLKELAQPLQKQYSRLIGRHGDVAVVPVADGHCGGCGTHVPPQVEVEVKKNDHLITCQSCGRMLIFYDA